MGFRSVGCALAPPFPTSKKDNSLEREHFPTIAGFDNAFFIWDGPWRTRREAQFPALLSQVRSFRASDPRDKVFAVLQHSLDIAGNLQSLGRVHSETTPDSIEKEPFNDLNIYPDYDMDTREVYRQVAVKSIHRYQNLEVLCYAWPTAHLDLSWPSWIPRWDTNTHGYEPVLPFLYNSTLGIRPSVRIQKDILIVQGIKLGPITQTDMILRFEDKYREQELSGLPGSINHLKDYLVILSRILVQDQWQEVPGDEITAERASKNPGIHFADFCAYLLPMLQIHGQDSYIPLCGMFCDECTESIVDHRTPILSPVEQFNCGICEYGDYDLCAKCYNQGRSCKDRNHQLTSTMATTFWCPYRDEIVEQLKEHATDGNGDRFYELCKNACARRMFFRVFDEWRGVGPTTVEAGDIVVALFGSRVPFVLRPQGDVYRLVADCYVHGFMDGEAIPMWKDGQLKAQEFKIC